MLLQAQGKQGEAESLLREVLAGCCSALDLVHSYARGSYSALLSLLKAQGRAREARELVAQFRGK